jgi:tRNA G26 N,N-dimethylase Trm1
MKLIDFYKKLIASISLKISNLLQLIDNSLQYVLRNELEMQIQNLYIFIKNTTTYCIYYIYPPIIKHFLAFLRVRIRVREAISCKKKLSPSLQNQSGEKHSRRFYAHYCVDCQMMYFGRELNVVKPCVRCGSTNVLNGPLMASKEKSANVAESK